MVLVPQGAHWDLGPSPTGNLGAWLHSHTHTHHPRTEGQALYFHSSPSLSLDDEGRAIELMHQEGQHGSFLMRWLGLEGLCAQAVTESWLHPVGHEEAAQDLRHVVSRQSDLRHLLPQNLEGLWKRAHGE